MTDALARLTIVGGSLFIAGLVAAGILFAIKVCS
jgi:hypothetical protein